MLRARTSGMVPPATKGIGIGEGPCGDKSAEEEEEPQEGMVTKSGNGGVGKDLRGTWRALKADFERYQGVLISCRVATCSPLPEASTGSHYPRTKQGLGSGILPFPLSFLSLLSVLEDGGPGHLTDSSGPGGSCIRQAPPLGPTASPPAQTCCGLAGV